MATLLRGGNIQLPSLARPTPIVEGPRVQFADGGSVARPFDSGMNQYFAGAQLAKEQFAPVQAAINRVANELSDPNFEKKQQLETLKLNSDMQNLPLLAQLETETAKEKLAGLKTDNLLNNWMVGNAPENFNLKKTQVEGEMAGRAQNLELEKQKLAQQLSQGLAGQEKLDAETALAKIKAEQEQFNLTQDKAIMAPVTGTGLPFDLNDPMTRSRLAMSKRGAPLVAQWEKQNAPLLEGDKELIKQGYDPAIMTKEEKQTKLREVNAKPLNEGQQAAVQYGNRMAFNEDVISKLPGFDPTSTVGAIQGGKMPFPFTNGIGLPNVAKEAAAQQYDAAKKNWISAALRKESGATISPSEFTAANEQYFPQFGDSAAVVTQKKELRDLAQKNMLEAAGAGAKNAAAASAPQTSANVQTATNPKTGEKLMKTKEGWVPIQ